MLHKIATQYPSHASTMSMVHKFNESLPWRRYLIKLSRIAGERIDRVIQLHVYDLHKGTLLNVIYGQLNVFQSYLIRDDWHYTKHYLPTGFSWSPDYFTKRQFHERLALDYIGVDLDGDIFAIYRWERERIMNTGFIVEMVVTSPHTLLDIILLIHGGLVSQTFS